MAELLVVIGISGLIIATMGLMHVAGQIGQTAMVFLVPVLSLFQVQKSWSAYRWWALARVGSFLTAIVGFALLFLSYQDVMLHGGGNGHAEQSGQIQRSSDVVSSSAFVNSEESVLLAIRGRGKSLSGRLHGETFNYDRVALIDGVLTLSQGSGFLSDLELRLLIGWQPEDITERRTLLVNSAQEDAPVIHLSWKPEGEKVPQTQIFKGGYRMELALAPLDTNQLSGTLTLVLPENQKSYVVGNFTAYSNHLRYIEGEVDLHFDHEDTLAYIARQYLRTQFPEGALDSIDVKHAILRRAESSGSVMSQVLLTNGGQERRTIRLEKSDSGWSVVPGSMETEVLVEAKEQVSTAVSPSFEKPKAPPRSVPEPINIEFLALKDYIGQQVTLNLTEGAQESGVLRDVLSSRLRLEMTVGSGVLERNFGKPSVVSVTLNTGQELILQAIAENEGEQGASVPQESQASLPARPLDHRGDSRRCLVSGLLLADAPWIGAARSSPPPVQAPRDGRLGGRQGSRVHPVEKVDPWHIERTCAT